MAGTLPAEELDDKYLEKTTALLRPVVIYQQDSPAFFRYRDKGVTEPLMDPIQERITQQLYDDADSLLFVNGKPRLDIAQAKGLFQWFHWYTRSKANFDELQNVRPERRYEHIATMARREKFAQIVINNAYTYMDMFFDFSGLNPESADNNFDLKSAEAEFKMMVNDEMAQNWGLTGVDEAVEVAAFFKRLLMNSDSDTSAPALIEQLLTGRSEQPAKEARTSLFAFFMLNRIAPAGNAQANAVRADILTKLGIPADIEYIDVTQAEDRVFNLAEIAEHLTHMNKTYVRTDRQKLQTYNYPA